MSILQHIQKGVNPRALGVCVYGEAGTGKTTFASKFPNPLILDTEQGSDHLDVNRLGIHSWEDFVCAIRDIEAAAQARQLPYETIVVDTLDHLWQQAGQYVVRVNTNAKIKNLEDFGYGKGYAITSDEFKSVFPSLKNIIASGVNVALICHCKVDKISLPDTPEFTRYCPKINAPSAQANASRDFIQEWVDGIYFCQTEVSVDADKKKALGGQTRVLHTVSNAAWIAKSRIVLPDKMPLDEQTAKAIFRCGVSVPVAVAPVAVAAPVPVAPMPQQDVAASQHAMGDDDASVVYRYLVATGQLKFGEPLNSLPNYEKLKECWAQVSVKARGFLQANPQ